MESQENILNTFLSTIFKFKNTNNFIELRMFDTTKKCTDQVYFKEINDVISYSNQNSRGKNVYYGINSRIKKQGTADAVATDECTVLFIDIDYPKINQDFTLAHQVVKEKIETLGLPPTITCNSGFGTHLYWCLSSPENWSDVKKTLLRLISFFGVADVLKDSSRIFRLPTTYNVKSKPYHQCKIVEINPERRYSLDVVNLTLTTRGVPAVIKKEEKITVAALSPTVASLGFTRKENRWECGICPSCGNSSLYIYDNNPTVAICSHTGNCKWTSSLTELENKIEKEKKKSDASFNKEAFVRNVVNQPPSIKVGYSNLDKHYHFRAGTINLIAGRLGNGKSTVLYNITLNAALLYPEENFLLFTYEIPKELVYLRMLTIEYARASKASITFDEIEEEVKTGGARAQFAMKRLERLNNIFVYDDPELSIEQLQEIVMETPNVGAIGIDYLECVKVKDKPTEELRVSSISTGLRKFAIKTNSFPIWLLSQLNRSPKERKDQRPREEDVRYSDKALHDAAIGWGLYDPSSDKSLTPKKKEGEEDIEVEEEEQSPIVKLEIIGLKNRYGRKTREVMILDKASGLLSQQIRRPLPQELEEETK